MKTMTALLGALLLFSTPATAQTTTTPAVPADTPTADSHFVFVSKDKQQLILANEVATSPEGFKRVLLVDVLATPVKTDQGQIIPAVAFVTTVDCTKKQIQIAGLMFIDDSLSVVGAKPAQDPEAWVSLPTQYDSAVCNADYIKSNDLGNNFLNIVVTYYKELTATTAAG